MAKENGFDDNSGKKAVEAAGSYLRSPNAERVELFLGQWRENKLSGLGAELFERGLGVAKLFDQLEGIVGQPARGLFVCRDRLDDKRSAEIYGHHAQAQKFTKDRDVDYFSFTHRPSDLAELSQREKIVISTRRKVGREEDSVDLLLTPTGVRRIWVRSLAGRTEQVETLVEYRDLVMATVVLDQVERFVQDRAHAKTRQT